MSKINKASRATYKVGRVLRWMRAFEACFKEKSLAPLLRRLVNVWVGRNVVSKLWLK